MEKERLGTSFTSEKGKEVLQEAAQQRQQRGKKVYKEVTVSLERVPLAEGYEEEKHNEGSTINKGAAFKGGVENWAAQFVPQDVGKDKGKRDTEVIEAIKDTALDYFAGIGTVEHGAKVSIRRLGGIIGGDMLPQ